MADNFIQLANSMNSPLEGTVKGLSSLSKAFDQVSRLGSAMVNLNSRLDGSAAAIGERITELSEGIESATSEQKKVKALMDRSSDITEAIEKLKNEGKIIGDISDKEIFRRLSLHRKDLSVTLEEYRELTTADAMEALTAMDTQLERTIELGLEQKKKAMATFLARMKERQDFKGKKTNIFGRDMGKINKLFDVQKEYADTISDFNSKSIAARMLAGTEEGQRFLDQMKGKAFKDWDFSLLANKNLSDKVKSLQTAAKRINIVGDIAGAGSGTAANTKISEMISGAVGNIPIWGQVYEVLKFLFDRGNELGRKGKELYEGTAGRYGYGRAFSMGNYSLFGDERGAMEYKNFIPTARQLAFQYGVSKEDVEATMKGLSAYTGIKAFKDLEDLAKKTLAIANATGLASDAVTQLGAAYQKNFGLTAKDSLFTAGSQLLGMMDDVNRGISQNLMLSNAEMAALMTQVTSAAGGINASKTLIPFIREAIKGANDLKFSSAVARDELVKLMMGVRLKGEGLPQGLAQFMLIQGGQFKNVLSPQQMTIGSQIGRGKFAYEAARELAATSTDRDEISFWGNDKFKYREDLADIAFKLASNDLPTLLGSLGPDGLADLTGKVMELYSIPGAEKVFKIPLPSMLSKFVEFARTNRAGYAALGGQISKIAGLAEASKILAAPPGTYSAQQIAEASNVRREFAGRMAPADRLNQLMEKLLSVVDNIALMFVDLLASPILKIGDISGGTYANTEAIAQSITQGLTKSEYNEYQRLLNNPTLNPIRLDELKNKMSGNKTTTSMLGGETVSTTTYQYNTGLARGSAYLTTADVYKR